jgi:hypothetical protein
MSKQYQKLGRDEEMGEVNKPSTTQSAPGIELQAKSFKVKVLLKETCLQLLGLTDETTIGQLKIEIEKLTAVAVESQRLIFSGKPLKADEKTIKSFNITENSSIHLFPIPPRAPIIEATALESGVTTSSLHPIATLLQSSTYPTDNHQPIHFDPEISQHCREVRLWSVILVFLCSMTLFNNISYALSTGINTKQIVFVLQIFIRCCRNRFLMVIPL